MNTFKVKPGEQVVRQCNKSCELIGTKGNRINVPIVTDTALYHRPWFILLAYTIRIMFTVFGLFTLGPWFWVLGGRIELLLLLLDLLLEVAFCIFMLQCPLGLLSWP